MQLELWVLYGVILLRDTKDGGRLSGIVSGYMGMLEFGVRKWHGYILVEFASPEVLMPGQSTQATLVFLSPVRNHSELLETYKQGFVNLYEGSKQVGEFRISETNVFDV